LKFVPGHLGIEAIAVHGGHRKGVAKAGVRAFVVPEHELLAAADTDPRVRISPHIPSASSLKNAVNGAHIAFAICGLGGSSGWRCAALAVRSARETGALAVAIAILPFSVEAPARRSAAHEQLERLRAHSDAVLPIHNDRIAQIAPNIPFLRAMEVVSELALLAPGELAAAATSEDLRALRHIFERAGMLASDVVAVPHGATAASAVDAVFRSEWLQVPASEVASAMLVVGSGSGLSPEAIAESFVEATPSVEVIACGESIPASRNSRGSRVCAVLGLKGVLR
jgi:cell division GTPase FtsZ